LNGMLMGQILAMLLAFGLPRYNDGNWDLRSTIKPRCWLEAKMGASADKALNSLALFGALYLGFLLGFLAGLIIGAAIDSSSYLPFYVGVVGGLIGAALSLRRAILKMATAKDWLVAVFALLGCVGIGSVVKNAPWVLPIVPHRLTDPANPLALEIGLAVGIVAAASVMVRRHRTHGNLERLRRRRRRSKRAI
jgi:hypothetical protein